MQANDKQRRKFIQLGLAGGISLIVPGSAFAGNIRRLSGSVYINKRKATRNSTIHSGDLVTTSHNGQIAFRIGGDAFLLKEHTSLQVGSSDNPLVSVLQLLTGKLLGVFESGRNRKIVTANATIGIRGTACFLNTTPRQLYYCNCYGETTLDSGTHHETFQAEHHSAYEIDFEGEKMMGMKATKVIDHTDEELRELESYVGRIPKFDQS